MPPVRLQPRTRPYGPHSYAHMTTGQLVGAALTGVALHDWLNDKDHPEQRFFEEDLERRGFTESLNAWNNDEDDTTHSFDNTTADMSKAETRMDNLGELTVQALENIEGAIDEVFFGDDGRTPGALSPAEVIEDMESAGVSQDVIEAYQTGVGNSDISLSEDLAERNLSPQTGISEHEYDEPAAEDTATL